MSVDHIEILVEEPSMEAALRVLVPRIADDLSFAVYPHQCKHDLLAKLPSRLRGYSSWLPDNWRIVVMVDRDDDDCHALKRQLERMASDAGLATRKTTKHSAYSVVNRLAIEELEAWCFGDWDAVRAAYPRARKGIPRKQAFRDPDAIRGGTWEALERILQRAGYFSTGLRKIEAARAIAQHMDPERNCSRSFRAFRDVIREMVR